MEIQIICTNCGRPLAKLLKQGSTITICKKIDCPKGTDISQLRTWREIPLMDDPAPYIQERNKRLEII